MLKTDQQNAEDEKPVLISSVCMCAHSASFPSSYLPGRDIASSPFQTFERTCKLFDLSRVQCDSNPIASVFHAICRRNMEIICCHRMRLLFMGWNGRNRFILTITMFLLLSNDILCALCMATGGRMPQRQTPIYSILYQNMINVKWLCARYI